MRTTAGVADDVMAGLISFFLCFHIQSIISGLTAHYGLRKSFLRVASCGGIGRQTESDRAPIVPFMALVFVYENINLPTLKNIPFFPRIADAPVRFSIRL